MSAGHRYLATSLVAALVATAGVCLLPHDRYARFSSLSGDGVKAKWIYERLTFDPRPIDVAFIGTSHTMMAVDGARVERGLQGRGAGLARVANLAMPYNGRNLHYFVTREVLAKKPVRLLVLELRERTDRVAHLMFGALADVRDIVDPVWILNSEAFSDLTSLPQRQLQLFGKSTLPAWFGPGPVRPEVLEPHWFKKVGQARRDRPWLDDAARQLSSARKTYLPSALAALEYRMGLAYTAKIVAEARAHRTAIAFLYLPAWGAAPRPEEAALYETWGPILTPPRALLDDKDLWDDATHFNHDGAERLSAWLGDTLTDGGLKAAP